ncbi:unnamed protein product [Darwinula stevensoni]|uniref:Uncharacterized protein n=1 Tax=Darwinula stevensoni TaxID=69355 RepID=A0A7R9ADC6_9CRUS|nr:unnamed protein product [Darwinula stevensoni]CAG0901187.1 unnamed protein product [Darwinula stevensoni]
MEYGVTCVCTHPGGRNFSSHSTNPEPVRPDADESLKMIPSTYLPLLISLVAGTRGQNPCPDPDEIAPCVCHFQDGPRVNVTVDCSGATSSGQIYSAFNDVSWIFNRLTKFLLTSRSGVKELPEGLFGDVTFQYIEVRDTEVASVHPTVLLSSKDELYHLSITESSLEDFPFDVLSQMTKLQYLNLRHNALNSSPVVQCPNLEYLDLTGNEISLESGWSMPSLYVLFLVGKNAKEVSVEEVSFEEVTWNREVSFKDQVYAENSCTIIELKQRITEKMAGVAFRRRLA